MTFVRAVANVLKHEGGLIDDPRDSGQLTNFGISQAAYPNEDIRAMTSARAAEIYERDFWAKIHGDALPDPISFALLDYAVNSGVSAAIRGLQKVLEVPVDGIFGPQTLTAVTRADPHQTVVALSSDRLAFLMSLPTWTHFGAGWMKRIIETAIEAFL